MAVCTAWFARGSILSALGSFLVESDPLRHADVAVVLGGDDYGTRILRAAELVKAGYAPYAVVSYTTFDARPECRSPLGFAVTSGYPPSLFRDLPHRAESTREEVGVIDHYLRKNHLHSLLLVTSNYHTRRAARLMRHQDGAVDVIAVPAPDPFFTADGWWKSRNGKRTFLLEWMKTVATWLGK